MSATLGQRLTLSLKDQKLQGVQSWEQWNELWEKARRFEELHSLFHIGFNVRCGINDECRRLRLYLEMADGFDNVSNFIVAGEDNRQRDLSYSCRSFGKEMTVVEARQAVAQKAWQVLSMNYFKRRDGIVHPWLGDLVDGESVMDTLMWFFRVGEDGRMPNLPRTRDKQNVYVKAARGFLCELCKLGWECDRSFEYVTNKEFVKRVIESLHRLQPDFLERLWAMRELLFLMDSKYRLDDWSMDKLQELALRDGAHVPTERTEENLGVKAAMNVGEVLAFGHSQAAQVYTVQAAMWQVRAPSSTIFSSKQRRERRMHVLGR